MGRYYVGVTGNLERRIEEHNNGCTKSTKPYRPWKIRKVEEFADSTSAYKRERFIKSKHSRKAIDKIIGITPVGKSIPTS